MSEGSELFLKTRWSNRKGDLLLGAWMLFYLGDLLLGRPHLFSGPDPLHQRPVRLGVFFLFVLMFSTAVFVGRWRPAGIAFEVQSGSFQFREMAVSLFTLKRLPTLEARFPAPELRFLESQHGVILKGPGFYRDLILPKDQTQALLEWMLANGIQRFNFAEHQP